MRCFVFFFFQAEDGIRDVAVTGVQTCALPIYRRGARHSAREGDRPCCAPQGRTLRTGGAAPDRQRACRHDSLRRALCGRRANTMTPACLTAQRRSAILTLLPTFLGLCFTEHLHLEPERTEPSPA